MEKFKNWAKQEQKKNHWFKEGISHNAFEEAFNNVFGYCFNQGHYMTCLSCNIFDPKKDIYVGLSDEEDQPVDWLPTSGIPLQWIKSRVCAWMGWKTKELQVYVSGNIFVVGKETAESDEEVV